MNISVVIPTSKHIPSLHLNKIFNKIKQQTLDIEIIASNNGIRIDGDLWCHCLIQTDFSENFNLSKQRNQGAKHSRGEWLAFSDCDIYYNSNLFKKMIETGFDVVRGNTLRNKDTVNSGEPSKKFKCGAAPLLIKRKIFEKIGGYCELYEGWGYEDSDIEHKLIDYGIEIFDFNSLGYHITEIHKVVKNKKWERSSTENRDLFLKRRKQPIDERIKQDLDIYNG